MRGKVAVISLALVLSAVLNANASLASPLQGKPCTKAGSVKFSAGVKYICKKSNQRLRWIRAANSQPKATPTIVPTPAPTLSGREFFTAPGECRLLDKTRPTREGPISVGFPNLSPIYDKTPLRVLALQIDYPSFVGSDLTLTDIKEVSDGIDGFYNAMSYGKLKIAWTPSAKVYRMPRDPEYYNLNRQTFKTPFRLHIFMQDAINAADSEIDFSKFDFIVLFSPRTVPYSLNGSYAGTRSGTLRVTSQEGQLFNIQTQPSLDRWFDGVRRPATPMLNNWAGLAHEMGHEFGLMDLYLYDSETPWLNMPKFDFMNSLWSMYGPEFIAWHRWLLGYLDDSQILCAPRMFPVTAEIHAVEINDGAIKAVVVPMSETQAVVIESRRAHGYDAKLPAVDQGLFVYLINTNIPTGQGPILSLRAGLKTGESFVTGNLKIEVLRSTTSSDVIQISRP